MQGQYLLTLFLSRWNYEYLFYEHYSENTFNRDFEKFLESALHKCPKIIRH